MSSSNADTIWRIHRTRGGPLFSRPLAHALLQSIVHAAASEIGYCTY